MKNNRWLGCTTLLITLSGSLAAQDAQDEVTIVQELTVSVRPGMEGPFEEFVKAFADVSRRQGLENYWLSAQSMSGEPVYRFAMTQDGWGDFGNPGPQLAEVLGEEEAARLDGLARDSITSIHAAFFEQHSAMSRPPVDWQAPPEALIYFAFALQPGGAPRFLELSTKTKEASEATEPNSYFVSALPSFGASGARTIVLLEHLSDLDTPQKPPAQRVVEHFGETEGARINALAGETIANIEATLFRTRPDLNYQPEN